MEVALGNPVERYQQMAGAAARLPVLSDACAQRVDVTRIIVEFRNEAQLGEPAPMAQLRAHLVVDRPGGGAAVLREERHHEDALSSASPQAGQRLRHRRPSIEHSELHRKRREHALRKSRDQLRAQPLGKVEQGRACARPDPAVLARRASGAQGKDQAVEDGHPQDARKFDDPWIREHPGKEAPHVARLSRLRRAGVHEQHADALGGVVVKVRGADVTHRDEDSLSPAQATSCRGRHTRRL